MAWTMYSAEDEAKRVAQEAADKVIADAAAKAVADEAIATAARTSQEELDRTAAGHAAKTSSQERSVSAADSQERTDRTASTEQSARTSEEHLARTAQQSDLSMTAREGQDKDLREIAALTKSQNLSMKELQELIANGGIQTDKELTAALNHKEGKDAPAKDGVSLTESTSLAAATSLTEDRRKERDALPGEHEPSHGPGVTPAITAMFGALSVRGAVNSLDSDNYKDGFSEDRATRDARDRQAIDMIMGVKDAGDAKAADYLKGLMDKNATKGEIEQAMAYLAAAEQANDKDIKIYDKKGNLVKEIQVTNDGNPSTSDVTVTTYNDDDLSGGGIVGGALAGMFGGGRGGHAGHGGRSGGMNAPLETALLALALSDGVEGSKELKAMTALLTGGKDMPVDPFSLNSPSTPAGPASAPSHDLPSFA